MSRFKFRLWNCPSYPQDSETAELHKAIIMNKAVTVLHCDRFCIIIANCPSPHRDRHFRTIPCYALYSCHMNALLALRPCKAFGGSTSGIHARPLSKGGGLTARHKLLLCCFLLVICPPFLYCKLFCRQDGGIVLRPHHQLDFPHSPTQKSAICNKQRILYIQFSALVKMVSGSKAIMY